MSQQTVSVQQLDVPGTFLWTPVRHGDPRGFFTERFRLDQWKEICPGVELVQDNFSRSEFGVLRGLHLQTKPMQAKLVTVTRGEVFDVAVDLRPESGTYGRAVWAELSGDRPQWLYVPEGFAHGFLVTSPDGADIWYKVSAPYNPAGEAGVRWDEPSFKIPWPFKPSILSARDQNLPFVENLVLP